MLMLSSINVSFLFFLIYTKLAHNFNWWGNVIFNLESLKLSTRTSDIIFAILSGDFM